MDQRLCPRPLHLIVNPLVPADTLMSVLPNFERTFFDAYIMFSYILHSPRHADRSAGGLLSGSAGHSGSFFQRCHEMQAAGFEFISVKSEAVCKNIPHNGNFFLSCVSGH